MMIFCGCAVGISNAATNAVAAYVGKAVPRRDVPQTEPPNILTVFELWKHGYVNIFSV